MLQSYVQQDTTMATQGKKNQISGSIGPLIYQQRYGTNIIRNKPDRVRQTQATKTSSTEFQYCSRWSKCLRLGLNALWLGNTDPLVSQRLTGALYAALQRNTALAKGERNWNNTSLSGLVGFEVNTHSPFESYCKTELSATLDAERRIQFSVPEINTAQSIRYPDGCSSAELLCYVTVTNSTSGAFIKSVIQSFTLNFSKTTLEAQSFVSEPLPEDSIIVVSVQLVYYKSNTVTGRYSVNTKKLNPGTLVWVGV